MRNLQVAIGLNKRHFSKEELEIHLRQKMNLSAAVVQEYRDHLNNCRTCWSLWNEVRWDAALQSRGLGELKLYLGKRFVEYFDSSWAIAVEWMNVNPSSADEIAQFYKRNKSYLYNLVIWYESGDRDPFQADMLELRNRFNVNSVIDYGCGVGNDGLDFLENGYEVTFVDYACPSVEFLRWRLKHRNLDTLIKNVEEINQLPDMDMFWAVDVLEHMVNPLWVVDKLSDKTRVFVHRSEFGNNAGGRHPCHFDFDEIQLGKALKKRGFRHIPWPTLSVWVKEDLMKE